MGLNKEYIDLSYLGYKKPIEVISYNEFKEIFSHIIDDEDLVSCTVYDVIPYNDFLASIIYIDYVGNIKNYYLVV